MTIFFNEGVLYRVDHLTLYSIAISILLKAGQYLYQIVYQPYVHLCMQIHPCQIVRTADTLTVRSKKDISCMNLYLKLCFCVRGVKMVEQVKRDYSPH